MMNYIWAGIIVVSFAVSVFMGRVEQTAAAVFTGAASAVEMCIKLLGIMCVWTGLMKIAEKGGLIDIFAKLLTPVTKILFPKLKKGSTALNYIIMNLVANIFGMSNAATPLGLSAMRELDKLNNRSGRASNEMCMFAVLNTASIQLIPSTIIALRHAAGSTQPGSVIVPIWITSALAAIVGVIAAKIMERKI